MPASTVQDGEHQKRPILRYLRIAFSAGCGTACLLLIAVSVRSYSTEDVISGGRPGVSRCMQAVSGKGKFKLHFYKASPRNAYWEWRSMPYASRLPDNGPYSTPAGTPTPSFSLNVSGGSFATTIPYWFLVLISGSLSAAPWVRWSNRFSLRTLLIVMTLIAALFGVIAITN